jgi:hypothetical protein
MPNPKFTGCALPSVLFTFHHAPVDGRKIAMSLRPSPSKLETAVPERVACDFV